jgi:hypothetical protein
MVEAASKDSAAVTASARTLRILSSLDVGLCGLIVDDDSHARQRRQPARLAPASVIRMKAEGFGLSNAAVRRSGAARGAAAARDQAALARHRRR